MHMVQMLKYINTKTQRNFFWADIDCVSLYKHIRHMYATYIRFYKLLALRQAIVPNTDAHMFSL